MVKNKFIKLLKILFLPIIFVVKEKTMSASLLLNGLNLTKEEQKKIVRLIKAKKATPKFKVSKNFVSHFSSEKKLKQLF